MKGTTFNDRVREVHTAQSKQTVLFYAFKGDTTNALRLNFNFKITNGSA
jgi:hypothetical protein